MQAVERDSQETIARGPPAGSPKLTIDRFSDGAILLLRFTGTIDEAFEGKRLGATVKAATLVLDLGAVKKISSFGIREWIDFVTAAGKQAGAIIIVECAPKVIDQLNMVANFAGSGRVFSFYAPFRCDYCDSEHRVLLQVDRDHDAIKSMKLAERPCTTCSESMYFDDDGATFFSYLNGAEPFELAPEVAAFLAAKLDYAVGDAARKLRVDKAIDGRVTYLRLSGDLDRGFPRDKLAEGLEGIVIADVSALGRIEPAGAAEWRAFVQTVAPLVDQLYVTGASVGFLDKLATAQDLGAKAQILTLVLPYACASCGTTGGQTIDVAAHHDVLKFATAPELHCERCQQSMACTAPETVMTILPGLPAPRPPSGLEVTIDLLRERALVAAAAKQRPIGTTGGRARAEAPVAIARTPLWVPLIAAILAVVIAGGGYLAYRATVGRAAPVAGLGAIAQRSAETRPAWVGSATPGAAVCADTPEHGLSCMAASAIALTHDDASDDAGDAAVDALAAAVASRITDPAWRAAVPAIYQASRDAKLAAYERDPTASVARREVAEARRAVATLARTTSGGALPAVPSARYWEQYDGADGKRWLAFAQLTITHAQLGQLTATYTARAAAGGATAVDLFPLVGWRYPKLERGAVIETIASGPLQAVGIAASYIVLGIDGHQVSDAAAFARAATTELDELAARGGTLVLDIQAGDGAPREFSTRIAAAPGSDAGAPAPAPASPSGSDRPYTSAGVRAPDEHGVNVWDRYNGGGRGSGRDDPDQ